MSNEQTMTPQQALQNLDGVVAQMKLDRQSTLVLMESSRAIQRLIDSIQKSAEGDEAVVAGKVEDDVKSPEPG